MRYLCAFAILLCLPVPAIAMPTAQFISQWRLASRISGGKAPAPAEITKSPELQRLVGEFSSAAQTYRQQILSARTAGTSPRACPPKNVDLAIDGVIADVERLPAGWQSREFSDSFAAVMDRRYPCPPARAQ